MGRSTTFKLSDYVLMYTSSLYYSSNYNGMSFVCVNFQFIYNY